MIFMKSVHVLFGLVITASHFGTTANTAGDPASSRRIIILASALIVTARTIPHAASASNPAASTRSALVAPALVITSTRASGAASIGGYVEQFGYHLGTNCWHFSPCPSVLNERPGPKTVPRVRFRSGRTFLKPLLNDHPQRGRGQPFTCVSRTLSPDAHKNTRRSRTGQLDASVPTVG
jgi:hypothetical protein